MRGSFSGRSRLHNKLNPRQVEVAQQTQTRHPVARNFIQRTQPHREPNRASIIIHKHLACNSLFNTRGLLCKPLPLLPLCRPPPFSFSSPPPILLAVTASLGFAMLCLPLPLSPSRCMTISLCDNPTTQNTLACVAGRENGRQFLNMV